MLRRRSIIAALMALVLALGQGIDAAVISSVRAAATLLPPAESCFSATTGVTGMVGVTGTITPGTGGTAGTYGGVALTGGSGSGATANITVAGGAVTAVTILNPGSAYVVGDVLSAASGNIGNVSGFSVPVSSVSINSALAGGSVTFYVPNTTTFKSTWFNADQSAAHQNTNPVTLDANGCAIIYGTGSYRQIVKDSLGNTVWDQVTTDTSANNNTFWAGIATGTPNAITVTDPGFNGTDGSIIQFTAIGTNTASTTLNPSSFGAISILKDTTAGPTSLVGGEIVQNNPISVIYRAVDNAFHLLNPPIQSASGSSAPLCGAVGYKVVNDGAFPNTILDVTATSLVMVSSTGTAISRSSVSVTANIGIVGPGGTDGSNITATTPYYLWLIDNGSAPAALISGSATSPALPANYSYSCRLSGFTTDGSTHINSLITLGNETHYITSTAGVITGGGASAGCGFLSPVNFQVLPTASYIFGYLSVPGGKRGGVGIAAARTEVLIDNTAGAVPSTIVYWRLPTLTTQGIFTCGTDASVIIASLGWVDNTNAH